MSNAVYRVQVESGCQFLKTRPDTQTEAEKEDVSGKTRTYGNPIYKLNALQLSMVGLGDGLGGRSVGERKRFRER